MSYYQFRGPVQGSYSAGMLEDEEARRRRRHYRDAGSPYSGRSVSAPAAVSAAQQAAQQQPVMPQDVTPTAPAAGLMPQQATQQAPMPSLEAMPPRVGAAVDSGSGPQQQRAPQQFVSGPGPRKRSKYAHVPGGQSAMQRQQAHSARGLQGPAVLDPASAAARARPGGRFLPHEQEERPAYGPHLGKRGYQPEDAGAPFDYSRAPWVRDAPHAWKDPVQPRHEQALKQERDIKFEIPEAAALRKIADQPAEPPTPPGPTAGGTAVGRDVPSQRAVLRDIRAQERQRFKRLGGQREVMRAHLQRPGHEAAAARVAEQLARKAEKPTPTQRDPKVKPGVRPPIMPQDVTRAPPPGPVPEQNMPYGRRQHLMRMRQQALQQLQRQNKDLVDRLGRASGEAHQIADIHGRKMRELSAQGMHEVLEREHKIGKQKRMGLALEKQVGEQALALGKERSQRSALEAAHHKIVRKGTQQLQVGAAQLVSSRNEQLRLKQEVADRNKLISDLTKEGHALAAEGNRKLNFAALKVSELHKKIADNARISKSKLDSIVSEGNRMLEAAAKAARELSEEEQRKLQAEIDKVRAELDRAKAKAERQAARPAPAAAPRQQPAAAAAPIIVQGGAGGGGASSSAGGSSAASGAGPRAAAAPDLSKVVEAVRAIAGTAAAARKKGGTAGRKGISQARRTYTDKRKTKIAVLRALKSKRIREFNTKTKKLPKGERSKQRREFKKKVNAQFREMQTRFPTARGLKSVGVIRELIRKLEQFKAAS